MANGRLGVEHGRSAARDGRRLAPGHDAAPAELGAGISLAGNPILVDETHVYYEPAFGDLGLTRIALAGGAPEKLPTNARDVFAVSDGYIYFMELGTLLGEILMRTPAGGGAMEVVTENINLFSAEPQFAFDGSVVYVSDDSSVYRIELGSPESRAFVHRLARREVGGNNSLARLILDRDRLVFVDGNGIVGWATTDGTECANILVPPDDEDGSSAGTVIDIALDDDHLYLQVEVTASSGGRDGVLYRVARAAAGL